MGRERSAQIAKLLKQCPREVILQAASICDGHTIFKPQAFIGAGLPAQVVEHFTITYKSDDSPKGTIYVSGQPVKELSGVYGLNLLRGIASALGVEYPDALGRGTEANHIKSALTKHFERRTPTGPPSA